jgi:hypothetical protein
MMHDEEGPSSSTRRGNSAVIYLPSIAPMDREKELAMRIAAKMSTRLKHYESVSRGHLHYGPEAQFTAEMHTLVEHKEPDGEKNTTESVTPEIDFFWFDYHDNLKGSWYRKPVLRQIYWSFLAVIFLGWHTCRLSFTVLTCFCCGRSRRLNCLTVMQVIFFILMVNNLALLYFGILFWAVIMSIWDIVEKSFNTRYAEKIIVWLTFLENAIIPFLLGDYRAQIINAAVLYLGMFRYLVGDSLESSLQSQLRSLMERLHNENYNEINLVCYSFGTLLAYDALFPRTELQLKENLYTKVNKLITVGFPYDLITMALPKHYSSRGRNLRDDVDLSWLNIFLPPDVLATHFASLESLQVTPNEEQQVVGPHTSCPVLDILLGGGIMAHGYYFSEDSNAAGDACDKIATALRPSGPTV